MSLRSLLNLSAREMAESGFFVQNVRELPPPTAEDLECEKDPVGYERREMARAWKEELSGFNRLKRLALALGVREVVVSPVSARPERQGVYKDAWTISWHQTSGWGPSPEEIEFAKEWGLSDSKMRSLNHRGDAVILINYWTEGACRVLAHEIGHHIYNLAKFTTRDQKRRVTKAMRRYFRLDTYVHESRDEICAECFAEFLTNSSLRRGVAKHCESILQRVRLHDPNAAKLVESQRFAPIHKVNKCNPRP